MTRWSVKWNHVTFLFSKKVSNKRHSFKWGWCYQTNSEWILKANIITDDVFFADTIDRPKKGLKQHKKSEYLKGAITNFGVSTAILNYVVIFRMWWKTRLNYAIFSERIGAWGQYFYFLYKFGFGFVIKFWKELD